MVNSEEHELFLSISLENFNLLQNLTLQAHALSYVSLSYHFQESPLDIMDAYLGLLNNLIANIAAIVDDIEK